MRITKDGWECVDCLTRAHEEPMNIHDQYGLASFTSADLKGLFDIRIEKGDSYGIELEGPENEKRRYNVYVNGETLVIDYDDRRRNFWKRNRLRDKEITVRITMPELHELMSPVPVR